MTPFLFASGAALAYYFAMPVALRFLLSYQGDVGGVTAEALPAIGNYLDFSMRFIFGFGVAFLLPVLLMLLEAAGLVTRKQLKKGRRYASHPPSSSRVADPPVSCRSCARVASGGFTKIAGRDLFPNASATAAAAAGETRPHEKAPPRGTALSSLQPALAVAGVLKRPARRLHVAARAFDRVASRKHERARRHRHDQQFLHSNLLARTGFTCAGAIIPVNAAALARFRTRDEVTRSRDEDFRS